MATTESATEPAYAEFVEENEWEGETWHFYIPLAGNGQALTQLAELIKGKEEYALNDARLSETEVRIRVANTDSGYMDTHTRLYGLLAAPDDVDKLYKGQIEDCMRKAEDDIPLDEITAAKPVGHHLGQLVDGESSPAGRPGWAEPEPGYAAKVDGAVEHFLSTTEPDEPDPETEAAMRAGFGDNPGAQMYASGYAAGEAAGKVLTEVDRSTVARGAVAAALFDLQRWVKERGVGLGPDLNVRPILDEIDRRLLAAKGEPIPVDERELPNRREAL